MSLAFAAIAPSELAAVEAFLLSGFAAPAAAVFAQPEVLRWKYFEPGPQWDASRSYVLRQNDTIKAHCGVWPMNLHFRGQQVSCSAFMDWLSDRDLPGAGVLVKKKLMRLSDTAIVVGGSADTRAVVPRIGFEHVSDVGTFARVVRPWKQFRTRSREVVMRGAARFFRNAAWSLLPAGSIARDWTTRQVESFQELPPELYGQTYPTPWRSASYLNYWLRTPAVKMSGFEILRRNQFQGYFLLSQVAGQARIVDVRLVSESETDWANAYRLATSVAAQDPDTCEIMTIASNPLTSQALHASGFRHRGSVPLFFYDPQKKLAGAQPLVLNMIDGDAAYLHDPAHLYVT